MGRTKRAYPQGRFRLITKGDESKDKLFPIHLEYTWNSTPIRKTTGVSCRVGDWNADGNMKRGELRASFGNDFRQRNAFLNKLLAAADERMRTFHEKGVRKMLTNRDVKSLLDGDDLVRRDKGKDFVGYVLECLEGWYAHGKGGIKISRYADGKSAMKIFKEFIVCEGIGTVCNGESVLLGEVSRELIERHIEWRRRVKKNKTATINHALTHIIKALEQAADSDLIERGVYSQVKQLRGKDERDIGDDGSPDRYLTEEQFKALLEYYERCELPRRREYIEMFLFSFHACGLRIIDIITLRWSDISFERRELSKVQVKTRNRNVIPLTPMALEILERWRSKGGKCFVFGLLEDDFDLGDEERLYRVRNSLTQSINQALKAVGEDLQLPFSLTCHCARHTFAVFALNRLKSPSVVSRLLGHQTTTITERVYAKFLPSTLQSEVENLHMEEFGR